MSEIEMEWCIAEAGKEGEGGDKDTLSRSDRWEGGQGEEKGHFGDPRGSLEGQDKLWRRWTGELGWQARWFSGELGREMVSVDGEKIWIEEFGVWNRMPGPDFMGAVVRVNGGPPRCGAVELDGEAQDWERHGHAVNSDFDSVILHVVVRQGGGQGRFFTRTSQHGHVPRVELEPLLQASERVADGVGFGALDGGWLGRDLGRAHPGRCAEALRNLETGERERHLAEAGRLRFERKARGIARVREAHGFGEALFQAVAVGLGYAGNELPFALLAQRFPVRFLAEVGLQECRGRRGAVGSRGMGLEALLFGGAGFLPSSTLDGLGEEVRAYVRRLWEEWWPYAGGRGVTGVPEGLWRFGRQRPLNHPQRRVAALVFLAMHWRAVVRLTRERDWRGLETLLMGGSHPFWDWHVTFQSERMRRPARILGRQKVQELLGNVFFPAAGDWEAFASWAKVEREHVRLVCMRARLGVKGRAERRASAWSVWESQGILEWEEGFCRRAGGYCARCRLPEVLREKVPQVGGNKGERAGVDMGAAC